MSTQLNPTSFRLPFNIHSLEDAESAIRYLASGNVDLNQAIVALKGQVDSAKGVTSSAAPSAPAAPANPAVIPGNTPGIAHEFMTAYDASTGAFTQAQPDFTDLTGVATPAQLPTATGAAEGIVQLAGDLGGTAPSPTVVSTHLAAALPIAQGGTGTTTPSLVGGSNISVTGSWPNQTIATVGLSVTIVTAQLTPGGTQGSMTFTNGILTAQTPAT